MSSEIRIVTVDTEERIDVIRTLFREYAASLGFDLGFQDFAHELAVLPGEYAPPGGILLLALLDDEPVGCVALRLIEDDICEMKRLFVSPAARSRGIGRQLATAIIDRARELGYTAMRLDTVPAMQTAHALYRSLGFTETPPYRRNPVPGARYLELILVPPA